MTTYRQAHAVIGYLGLCLLGASSQTWAAEPNLVQITPHCTQPGFKLTADSKSCENDATFFSGKTTQTDCTAVQGVWTPGAAAGAGTCAAPKPATPSCGDLATTSRVQFKDGACFYDNSPAVSDDSNYIGDCFVPTTTLDNGLSAGKKYMAIAESTDKTQLRMVPATSNFLVFCTPESISGKDNAPTSSVLVTKQSLMDSGPVRTGWVYGVLTLPYKFYTGDKSVSPQTSIGPYLGARASLWGLSWTHAVTLGLTHFSALTKDAQGKYVLDADNNPIRTEKTGFTMAYGWMFDVSKGAKPFKSGVFIGRDYASKDNGITLPNSGKTWVAVQLGFDFTE